MKSPAEFRCTTLVGSGLVPLPPERVHHIDVPLHSLLQVYARWGQGTAELVAAMGSSWDMRV